MSWPISMVELVKMLTFSNAMLEDQCEIIICNEKE
jgi:hypothetical protein